MNTRDIIYKWVVDNFGESEANDPSWSIDALAKHLDEQLLIVTDQTGEVTTHDLKANGHQYILEWTHANDDRDGYIAITEACDDTPCDWFVNDATTPSWCCNTHMFDGTGDYPATGEHPEVCDFADVDEDGECRTEHETYDFTEFASDKQFDAIIAKNNLARAVRDDRENRSVLNELFQLEEIEKYTGQLNQPTVREIIEDTTGNI